jgi:hypothetical protein
MRGGGFTTMYFEALTPKIMIPFYPITVMYQISNQMATLCHTRCSKL